MSVPVPVVVAAVGAQCVVRRRLRKGTQKQPRKVSTRARRQRHVTFFPYGKPR